MLESRAYIAFVLQGILDVLTRRRAPTKTAHLQAPCLGLFTKPSQRDELWLMVEAGPSDMIGSYLQVLPAGLTR